MRVFFFLQKKVVVREKKLGKQFQYDIANDLVMTFISEVIATAIMGLIGLI